MAAFCEEHTWSRRFFSSSLIFGWWWRTAKLSPEEEKKKQHWKEREREVIKFLFGPPNGRERRYSTPKVGHKRKKRQRGGERIYELEKNVFFFFTSSSSLFFFPFFFSSLYPASVPENFSSSFHLCVCVTLVEREERAIGRPFSQLTRQTRYNRKRFFFSLSPILFLILFWPPSSFFLSIIPSLPTIASLPIWILEIQRSGGGAHNRHFIVPSTVERVEISSTHNTFRSVFLKRNAVFLFFFFFLPKTSRSALLLGSSTRQERPAGSSFPHTHIEPSFGRFFLLLWLVRKIQFFFFSSFLESLSLFCFHPSFLLCVYFARGEDSCGCYILSLYSFLFFFFFFPFSLRGRLSAFGHPVRHATHALHVAPSTHTHTTGREEKRSFLFFVILVGLAIDGRENRNGIELREIDIYVCVYVLAGGLWIHHVTLENQLDLIFSPKETKLLFVSRAFRFGVSVIFGRLCFG